jgi:hypothetical protein
VEHGAAAQGAGDSADSDDDEDAGDELAEERDDEE